MPTFDWQLIVALLALTGAVWFLVRRGLKLFRTGPKGGGACGSCGSCAASPPAAGSPPAFVPLESLAVQNEKSPRMNANERE